MGAEVLYVGEVALAECGGWWDEVHGC
jgi:hypothetical protein